MSSEEELQEKARIRIGEADSDAEKDDDSTEHDGDVTVTSSPCASVSSSCTKLHVCGTASRGNRQMSACSSHSNSTTSLDSFVVVHTELVHPSLAIDEAEELAAERKALCSSHEESSTDSATGGAAGENQTSKDAEMNRMLLDAYTKLTKTMASSAKAKTRSISASVDAPTSSSSSFESTANGKDAEQREDVATAASVNVSIPSFQDATNLVSFANGNQSNHSTCLDLKQVATFCAFFRLLARIANFTEARETFSDTHGS